VKKLAVIDCGTNTFNLLVVEATKEGWIPLFTNKVAVKLGEGGFDDKVIRRDRFARGLDALLVHHTAIQSLQCDEVFAFATSALREASNGSEFVAKAAHLFGLEIELISGDREAELIWEGVRLSMDIGTEPALIMDIGGGSTEFIIANAQEVFWKKSYLLGVSRLHDRVRPAERIDKHQLHELENLLREELSDLQEALKQFPVTRLIGSSGSFDTLRAMHYRDGRTEQLSALHAEIPMKGFHQIHHWLLGSSMSDRLKHTAIPNIRAEFMPMASHLVFFVLQMHPFKQLIHSAYSLKEGAIHSVLQRLDWPAEEPAETIDDKV
jgi:exopolyphosphatase/guanosine-5'-triphosphate,3'-diphosphate pyrophosphatase